MNIKTVLTILLLGAALASCEYYGKRETEAIAEVDAEQGYLSRDYGYGAKGVYERSRRSSGCSERESNMCQALCPTDFNCRRCRKYEKCSLAQRCNCRLIG